MMRLSILTLFLISLISCKNEKERAIVGKWNAAQLVECDDLVPLTNTPVNLEFMPNGSYTFNSTLNVHEAGEFYIKKNHLYTQDKLREKASQKIVKIQHLVGDTLVLEMNYKGKEQWLTLVRQKESNLLADNSPKTNAEKPQTNVGSDTKSVALASPADKAAIIPTPEAPKEEVKPEPKKEEKKDEDISAAEAYRRREALRQKEEAERIQAEKEKRDGYLKREAQRIKEEKEKRAAYLERERDREREEREAYLKREAKRKKEEAERKRKS